MTRKVGEGVGPSGTPSTLRSAAGTILGGFRRIAVGVRHLPDRLLHGLRRRRARRRLARAKPVGSALFICHGNVCRSPFAELLFARMMAERGLFVATSSAGFIGPDRQPPAGALAAAARRGLDMTAHRSMLVTAGALNTADLVVTMSAQQVTSLRHAIGRAPGTVILLGDLDPWPIRRRTVVDPWGGDARLFDESYDRIERCLAALANVLSVSATSRSGHSRGSATRTGLHTATSTGSTSPPSV